VVECDDKNPLAIDETFGPLFTIIKAGSKSIY